MDASRFSMFWERRIAVSSVSKLCPPKAFVALHYRNEEGEMGDGEHGTDVSGKRY